MSRDMIKLQLSSIFVARPEFHVAWEGHDVVTAINLEGAIHALSV